MRSITSYINVIVLLISAQLCYASDMDGLKQTLANRICPRPVRTYALIEVKEACGLSEDHSASFDDQVAWNKCSDKNSIDNNTISKYNSFVRENCQRHSGDNDIAPKSTRSHPSNASQAVMPAQECHQQTSSFIHDCKNSWDIPKGSIAQQAAQMEEEHIDQFCDNTYNLIDSHCGVAPRSEITSNIQRNLATPIARVAYLKSFFKVGVRQSVVSSPAPRPIQNHAVTKEASDDSCSITKDLQEITNYGFYSESKYSVIYRGGSSFIISDTTVGRWTIPCDGVHIVKSSPDRWQIICNSRTECIGLPGGNTDVNAQITMSR